MGTPFLTRLLVCAVLEPVRQVINAGALDDELKQATGKHSPAPKQVVA
jgi:hypothetical protein